MLERAEEFGGHSLGEPCVFEGGDGLCECCPRDGMGPCNDAEWSPGVWIDEVPPDLPRIAAPDPRNDALPVPEWALDGTVDAAGDRVLV